MKKIVAYIKTAARVWISSAVLFSLILAASAAYFFPEDAAAVIAVSVVLSIAGSLPAFAALLVAIAILNRVRSTATSRIRYLAGCCFLIASAYGVVCGAITYELLRQQLNLQMPAYMLICTVLVFACSLAALALNYRSLVNYFGGSAGQPLSFSPGGRIHTHKINQHMEPINTEQPVSESSNKVLVKGLITGVLILVMMIPTFFVSNLVNEREQRQREIVQEVSSKWASEQRFTGPYIVVPYVESSKGNDGKIYTTRRNLVLLPEKLKVSGSVTPHERKRSIYKVLLYESDIHSSGQFNISLPEDVVAENIDFSKAKICMGVTDFKGIQETITIRFNNTVYTLTPGLPSKDIDDAGLSAPVALAATDLGKPLAFSTGIRLKGSSALNFLPLSANSEYTLQSKWPDPSFDGSTLPAHHNVRDTGFTANWKFYQANLPFGTAFLEGTTKTASATFGVNMLQPADQYAKTMRSVKYAILFIGLTFGLFFIIELMQRRPFHPVQYILVGLALVIFYTLLLSVGEFIPFDFAYILAAVATVSLISLYAQSHFKSWKVALVFAGVLGCLYGFIFVLIRLEDTALLVGSIGLFIVLALVMYASRKVNWYGQAEPVPAPVRE
ncbi:MAG TPA: cell envelope integrity protein CreD [Chitinophagaceae bacterium]